MLITALYIIEGFIEMRRFSKIWLGSVDAVNLLNPAMFKCPVGPGRTRSESVGLSFFEEKTFIYESVCVLWCACACVLNE